jgi:hypothetical protein
MEQRKEIPCNVSPENNRLNKLAYELVQEAIRETGTISISALFAKNYHKGIETMDKPGCYPKS